MASPLLFDELIERLRREGFSVGTDQYLRMHELFARDAEVSPEELKTRLCPVFAMSAEEQARFHLAWDDFFTPQRPDASRGKVTDRILHTLSGTFAIPKIEPPPPPRRRWKRVVAAIAGVALAVLIVMLVMPRFSGAPGASPGPPSVSDTSAVTETATAPQDQQEPVPLSSAWLLIAGLGIGVVAVEISRTVLRWLRHREHRGQGRPFDWPLHDPAPTAPRLFADPRFFSASRLLKGREAADVRRLDVARTVSSTIRALGDPVFEYTTDRRASEYLFLVERLSERDHFATYVHAMIAALARDGVLVEVWEHDGDPRLCWKAGTSARVSAADLHHRFPRHRLIIVGRAAALTNPITGEALESIPRLFPWTWRAILTPDDETSALRRFHEYFDVYAIAENGLARLAERWQQTDGGIRRPSRRRAAERRLTHDELPTSVLELEETLEPLLFAWLMRCAAHPTLHWDLTRALGPQLPAVELEAQLLALARVSWFRAGRMPETLRLELVARLATLHEDETVARTTTTRLLASSPPPPDGSVAARVFQIQQLGHRIWKAREQPAELRPLVRELRRYPPSQIARDGALMMLLREAPGAIALQLIPRAARRFFFREGIPAFGAHSFLGAALLLPVLMVSGYAMQQDPPVPTVPRPPVTQTTASMEPPPPIVEPSPSTPVATPVAAATPAGAVIDILPMADPADPAPKPKEEPVVAMVTRPAIPPPPIEIPLAALPTLQQPNDEIFELETVTDRVSFTWDPPGSYTLTVRDETSRVVLNRPVTGAGFRWKPEAGTSSLTWTLTTSDGRTTDALPFVVRFNVPTDIDPVYTRSSVHTVTFPISCAATTMKHTLDLELRPGETVDTVEFQIVDKGPIAKVETRQIGLIGKILTYEYRFDPAGQPCDPSGNTRLRVNVKIRVPAAAPRASS